MADFRKTIDDIHFKVGEMHGMMSVQASNCADTHKTVDDRLNRIENRVIFFLWALLGLAVTVILNLLAAKGA